MNQSWVIEESKDLIRTIFELLGVDDGLKEVERRLRCNSDPRIAWGVAAALDYIDPENLSDMLLRVLTSSYDPEPAILTVLRDYLGAALGTSGLSAWIQKKWRHLRPEAQTSVVTSFHECHTWDKYFFLWNWLSHQEMTVATRHAFCSALATTLNRHPSVEVRILLTKSIAKLGSYPENEVTRNRVLQHFLKNVRSLLE